MDFHADPTVIKYSQFDFQQPCQMKTYSPSWNKDEWDDLWCYKPSRRESR